MYDRYSYEDRIVDLLHNSLQENLTGRVNLKFQYPMTKTIIAVSWLNDAALPGCLLLDLTGLLRYTK